MRSRLVGWTMAACAAAALIAVAVIPVSGQAPYKAPRTKDGKPNLNGVWQANNEANWNIAPHGASQGPVLALGRGLFGSARHGRGRWSFALHSTSRRETEREFRQPPEAGSRDQVLHGRGSAGELHAVPIPDHTGQQRHHDRVRVRRCGAHYYYGYGASGSGGLFWMGWSNERKWDGETLVVDVTGMNDQTWFDR